MATTPPKRQRNSDTPEVTSKYYLTNSQLLPEVISSKGEGKMSPKLATMLMMLARRYASRPFFSGYTFKEDMIAEALADLCKNALKFNPERSDNPFAFYTSCIHNSFLGYLNMEKKHRKIRDQLLVDIGENPSYNFQEEYRASIAGATDSREELTELKNDIEEAKERKAREDARAAAILAGNVLSLEPTPSASILVYGDETKPTDDPAKT